MTRQERELRKIDKRWEYLLKTYGGRPMQELLERLDNSLKENAALLAENERLKRAVERVVEKYTGGAVTEDDWKYLMSDDE